LAVFLTDKKELGKDFIEYDTAYGFKGNYPLPSGKLLVLLLYTYGHLWTTIRRYIPYKETYYRGLIGQDVEIKIV
jgi:hypothetical protein